MFIETRLFTSARELVSILVVVQCTSKKTVINNPKPEKNSKLHRAIWGNYLLILHFMIL